MRSSDYFAPMVRHVRDAIFPIDEQENLSR